MAEKIYFDINDLYKTLKKCDQETLKHFNDESISDEEYFLYGINSDIFSSALHIIINILSGNIESAGVDSSCRSIIEAFTILEMNAKGDISPTQKTIYKYSYSYVDLDNFCYLLPSWAKDSPALKLLMKDREKCRQAITEHFRCSASDLKDKSIFVGDPCFYLKKRLKDTIRPCSLIRKYFPDNKRLLNFYEFFSLFVHPRCEMDQKAEKKIFDARKAYIDSVIDIVFNYLKSGGLLTKDQTIADFNSDFFFNPLLKNNIHNLKEIGDCISFIKNKFCFFRDGQDSFSLFFLNKVKNMLIDAEISMSLGYKEQVISVFKPFIELYAVFYQIEKREDINEFNYLKKAYWISSRKQIFEHFKRLGIQTSEVEYDKDLQELYICFYKEKYSLNSYETFVNNIEHNSLYFLSNGKKNYNKYVKEAIEETFPNVDLSGEFFALYRISKDTGHASGYNFNASEGIVDISCHKVLMAMYSLLLNFVIQGWLTLKEHNIECDISGATRFLKSVISLHREAANAEFEKHKTEVKKPKT